MRLIFTRRPQTFERVFDAICFVLGWALLLSLAFAMLGAVRVEAATNWFYFEVPYKSTPPSASSCGGKITACQNNAVTNSWQCYCVQ